MFGELRPTAYGRELLPRLTVLSAAATLSDEMKSEGAPNLETMTAEEFIDASPATRRMADVGRALSEVEMRGPDGAILEFESIAFIDLAELRLLARDRRATVAPEARSEATSRILVSATLAKRRPASPVDRVGMS